MIQMQHNKSKKGTRMESTLQRLIDIIQDILVVKVEPKSSLQDLGADEIDRLELIMTYEEKFDEHIGDELANKIRLDMSIDDIASMLDAETVKSA